MSLLNLHLGDNADVNDGDFANTTYVGLSVALPLRMLNPSKRNQFVIYTSAIETLADWQSPCRNARFLLSRISQGQARLRHRAALLRRARLLH